MFRHFKYDDADHATLDATETETSIQILRRTMTDLKKQQGQLTYEQFKWLARQRNAITELAIDVLDNSIGDFIDVGQVKEMIRQIDDISQMLDLSVSCSQIDA